MKRCSLFLCLTFLTSLASLTGCQVVSGNQELLVRFPTEMAGRAAEIHRQMGAILVSSAAGVDLVRAPLSCVSRYQALGALAEPNRTLRPQMVGGFRPLSSLSSLPSFRIQLSVNDPLIARQGVMGPWWLSRVQASSAWDTTAGSDKIRVAVIDTGVDQNHPDLRGNLLTGRNFVETSQAPEDDFGHGTHVAGIIGALANNGEGGAGLAFRCKILPIRVLGTNGGSTFQLVQGIQCAIDSGAKVINMSLGSSQYSSIEEQAVKEAMNRGIVVVAAAGNDALSGNPLSYPAAIRGVISVAATDYNDHRGDFSNYNSFVSLSAPGVDILSTLPTRMGRYGFASGTSMASPIVAGAAALLLSQHPDWSPSQVKNALANSNTCKDLVREAGKDPGYDPFFGYGLLQVSDALAQ